MLVIYAHFTHRGHCGEILKNVVKELDVQKTPYELLDLYKTDFDPLFRGERIYDDKGMSSCEAIRDVQKKVAREKKFIVIYPVWWDNVPAVLKGFFDRVFLPRFAFLYYKRKSYIGLFEDKRALILATAARESDWYERFFQRNRALKAVTKGILKHCGMKTSALLVGGCQTLTEEKKQEIQRRVSRAVRKFVK